MVNHGGRHFYTTPPPPPYHKKRFLRPCNQICRLLSSSCFQQHFHDWFNVFRYNSGLSKLKWTLLLFNFNYIRDLAIRRKFLLIPIAEYASFSHQARTLKTNLLPDYCRTCNMNDYPKNNTLISENIGHKRPTILEYFDAYICHHY